MTRERAEELADAIEELAEEVAYRAAESLSDYTPARDGRPEKRRRLLELLLRAIPDAPGSPETP